MKGFKRLAGVGAAALIAASLAGSGSASAAFPDFSDCPTADVNACFTVQSTGGSMTIKDMTVPLGDSLRIAGGFRDVGGNAVFVPPAGSNGFIARPIQVPGGLLGIDWPIPGNEVTATATLAGPASSMEIIPGNLQITMPMKLKLDNPILGPWCRIGTDSNPANVNLIVGTTDPPAPNTPISGRPGRTSVVGGDTLLVEGSVNVDNSFAIPGASHCGINLGLINGVINLKLGLPSAAGNNTLIVENDSALKILP